MHIINKQVNILQRLAAVVLCLLLAVLLLPLPASALEGSTGELQWELWGGTLTVSGSGPMPDYTDANMPPWYDSAEAVNRIVVAEGVTSIGSLAFYGCSTAQSVSLGSTVTSIGDRAFKNCRSVTYMGFPSGLLSIGEAAFESCEKLNGIRLPSSLQSLGNYAFNRCISLSHITVPASVTDFGMVVFAYCTGLTRAVIQCPITKVPDWTFYGCTALSAVSLPETVTETGEYAFHDCQNLGGVYYSGAASGAISDALKNDSTTKDAVVIEGAEQGDLPNGSAVESDGSTSIITNVKESENASITQTDKTDYTYTVNGEPATIEEVLTSGEGASVEATGKTETEFSATVENSEGWKELSDTVKDTLNKREDSEAPIKVNVQLPGSQVSGEELKELAGKDVIVSITTDSGNTWIVDQSEQSKNSFGKETYDLGISVERLDKNTTKIKSDTVYKVKFASDTDFSSTVGINLKVGNAYQYATLYQKELFGLSELQTVMVDESGNAWFSLANVDSGTKYYVGINVEGVDKTSAVIPSSLEEAHGIDYTLTDSSGQKYQITGRFSSWGITGTQFAIYVAIAFGGLVLLVTLVMVTLNKISKSKAKYSVSGESEAVELDEEAIRLQVLQEMLEEKENKKGNNGNKNSK